jgi:hypothetical protein
MIESLDNNIIELETAISNHSLSNNSIISDTLESDDSYFNNLVIPDDSESFNSELSILDETRDPIYITDQINNTYTIVSTSNRSCNILYVYFILLYILPIVEFAYGIQYYGDDCESNINLSLTNWLFIDAIIIIILITACILTLFISQKKKLKFFIILLVAIIIWLLQIIWLAVGNMKVWHSCKNVDSPLHKPFLDRIIIITVVDWIIFFFFLVWKYVSFREEFI